MPNRSGRPQTMFPGFISSQSQQLGQNLNLGQEYTPETAAKMQALERRQQLANILLQQGMQPKEARQAGRFVVAPSLWEQASGPLTTAMGALSSLYLDDQRSALASDEAKRVAAAYQAYNEGTSDDPGYVGRRVAGTGVQGVEAQPAVEEPSNLESIIAAGQLTPEPVKARKSVADVTNAIAQRQRPPMLQSNPQWDGPAAIPTPYRPAVETKAAVPGVVGTPDRRESPYEALEREFGAQAAQDFVNNGFAPGTTLETAARMERVIKDAERPDAPGRPRTPGELMAADTALLASGAPGAWPLIQLTKQQREMDLARKETREDRALDREALNEQKREKLILERENLDLKRRQIELDQENKTLNREQKAELDRKHRETLVALKMLDGQIKEAKLGPGQMRGPDGAIQFIPGSPQGSKDRQKWAGAGADVQATVNREHRLVAKIDALLDPKNASAFKNNFRGYLAYGTRYFSPAFKAELDSLQEALKVEGLDVIRRGGSIGQMTEKEWPIVRDMLAKIVPEMGEDAAREKLIEIKAYAQGILASATASFNDAWGESQWEREKRAKASEGGPMGQPSSYAKPTVPITPEEKASVLSNPKYNLGGR